MQASALASAKVKQMRTCLRKMWPTDADQQPLLFCDMGWRGMRFVGLSGLHAFLDSKLHAWSCGHLCGYPAQPAYCAAVHDLTTQGYRVMIELPYLNRLSRASCQVGALQ